MVHSVDGFELRFTSRTSWKAERREAGNLGTVLDVIPVTWTNGFVRSKEQNVTHVQVWFRDKKELEAARLSVVPFVVAVAEAHDWNEESKRFKHFAGIYEVQSTGEAVGENSIQTKLLRRVTARPS